MLRRGIVLLCAVFSLAVVPAGAQDEQRIAQGVSAGGVDLSNLTVEEAQTKLEGALTVHLQRDLIVGAAGKPWRLTMAEAKLRFDALATAKHALEAPPAAAPEGGGAVAGTIVPLVLSHSHLAVKAFVREVGRAVYHAPRSATLKITVRKMLVRRAKPGKALDPAAAGRIDAALDDGAVSRRLHEALVRVRPAVNANDLRRSYGTVVTVDRSTFTLRLFKQLRFVKRYGIAVGMAGLDTPSGRYTIHNKQVDPAWHVPNSAWAGSLAGQTIPGGAYNNPLKARWLGIANGVGIHGTAEEWSIGSRASHGCIRMRVADVKDLYPRVPVGAAVLIR